MSRLALLLGAASLLTACDTVRDCRDACERSGLSMEKWDGTTCTCLVPSKCELERRAADQGLFRAEVGVALLSDCREALASCEARGGGR